jgi:hypothetical protein
MMIPTMVLHRRALYITAALSLILTGLAVFALLRM